MELYDAVFDCMILRVMQYICLQFLEVFLLYWYIITKAQYVIRHFPKRNFVLVMQLLYNNV